MTFVEELGQIIADAMAEHEKFDTRAREFAARWNVVERTVISVFDTAVEVLAQGDCEGTSECRNGSVTLKVKRQSDKGWLHWLRFEADRTKLEVSCKSSLAKLAKSFDKIEREGVELEVKQFVQMALKPLVTGSSEIESGFNAS